METIAPALRLLEKRDEIPSIVSVCQPDDIEGEKVLFDLPENIDDPASLITALREQLGGLDEEVEAVVVPEKIAFKIESAAGNTGRVAGKVAIVTGAAQGFGLEIAQDLASQGARVALADLNVDGVEEAADGINQDIAPGMAIGLEMNVTDEASVHKALLDVIRKWGGFDIFVANAGVLKADSVKTFDRKDFDFVTKVNYTGYFVCAQAAARVLMVQHLADPTYRSDLIQINSKSGLTGSNKNAAYAGSKFGGIGLTQSFALELVEDGVKVNSICPGNFFDGPLWSDPDNGLFVQYLQTGKVPGAKTLEDVKHFYEAKVPMGRGCRTEDVMHALYYLVDQQYETGQAVPVTGGQTMLK
ncbi:MAG: SDR family NAD(P)-dependent oxidoreductase [Candidatus Sumerlaeota bacterium]